ncbi:MAG TPA: alpha-L-rhamnosidase C-terminal domain-containing protein, partial [Candidatus Methylacidiphilales bacterium]
GPADLVHPGGGPGSWRPLWWRCGTSIHIEAEAGAEPLTLERLALVETRHPLRVEARWKAPDPAWNRIFAIGRRTLEMCLHETFMDCPYYEQLMYVGDTRIQCLLAYALARDDRPQRKALALFDSSRTNPTGLVAANHPSRGSQLIAPFALWWIAMIRDFAWWRGDRAFVRERLPGVRAVVDFFAARVDAEGLLRAPEGWNFVDSAYRPGGVPPGAETGGRSAVLQAQWTLALGMAAEVEAFAGEPEHAARCRRLRAGAARALVASFWDDERGLLADRTASERGDAAARSEHAQCLALLAGALDAPQQARVWRALEQGAAAGLLGASCYFSHYAFEACLAAGRGDLFAARLAPWKEGLREGFRTTPENFGETRSDCHAWSANPLFHYLSGVLGIGPGSWGFESVLIAPCLPGTDGEASGTVAHPRGPIRVALERRREKVRAEISLPPGLSGAFRIGNEEHPLHPGRQRIDLAPSSSGSQRRTAKAAEVNSRT